MRRSPAFFTLIVFGAIALLVGIIVGVSSHQITYQSVGRGTIAHYIASEDGTGYLQMTSSPTLYVVNENDFTPIINGIDTFKDGDAISFFYQPDNTTDIDVTSKIGTHLVGKAYTIVQITLFDTNGQTIFATSAYKQHPQGYSQNNWGLGILLILAGLAMVGGSFFVGRNRLQPSFNAAPGAMMGNPMGMQAPANPYAQASPYQGTEQYPHYQQHPQQYQQYPSQPDQYPPASQYPAFSAQQPMGAPAQYTPYPPQSEQYPYPPVDPTQYTPYPPQPAPYPQNPAQPGQYPPNQSPYPPQPDPYNPTQPANPWGQ
jgi:hypothetical protein